MSAQPCGCDPEAVHLCGRHSVKIEVALLGSGWAALMLVFVRDASGKYWDVERTGVGRYATRDEAVFEAKSWALSEDIDYIDTSK
jgi:hypothetical protein